MSAKQKYPPPANPPPNRSLLKAFAKVHDYSIDLERLASQGWTTLALSDSPSDPLYSAYTELFQASSQFLCLPEEERMRYRVAAQEDSQVSEEGYSCVEGEKCMIALRKAQTTPTEFGLREKAETAWQASAAVMRDVLAAIEESLGMKPGMLVRATEKQLVLPEDGERNVASLMRMFRYDRPIPPSQEAESGTETGRAESRVVSEPHKDLGLLTIVLGHSPGLECWDAQRNVWVSCEEKQGLNATILTGQTLFKFTNGRFVAGRHRVFVHPSSGPRLESSEASSELQSTPLSDPRYRFSLVHALRGHLPLRVSSADFETPVTGPYHPSLRFQNASISEIYRAISDAHWNVNISVEERRKQEQALLERAERGNVINERFKDGEQVRERGSSRRFSKLMSVFRRSTRQSTAMS